MSTNLQTLQELSGKRKTQQQQFLSLLLDEKNCDINSLLVDLIEIAQTASKTTATGEVIDDYKTRLAATKLLLELRGDYTPAKQNMNVSLGFASIFYGNKKDDNETIIQSA